MNIYLFPILKRHQIKKKKTLIQNMVEHTKSYIEHLLPNKIPG